MNTNRVHEGAGPAGLEIEKAVKASKKLAPPLSVWPEKRQTTKIKTFECPNCGAVLQEIRKNRNVKCPDCRIGEGVEGVKVVFLRGEENAE